MNFKDIVNKKTTYSFKEDAFDFGKAYRVKYKGETHICLLEAYSEEYVEFSYGPFIGVTSVRITPEELMTAPEGEIEIIEAVFKIDIPTITFKPRWKTMVDAYTDIEYLKIGECYEIAIKEPFKPVKVYKGYLSSNCKSVLQFVCYSNESKLGVLANSYDDLVYVNGTACNGQRLLIDAYNTKYYVKIRKLG